MTELKVTRYGIALSQKEGSPLHVVCALTDAKIGAVFVVAGDREWTKVRVTPSGLLRVSEVRRGVPDWIKEPKE